jgi:hypothetical protein
VKNPPARHSPIYNFNIISTVKHRTWTVTKKDIELRIPIPLLVPFPNEYYAYDRNFIKGLTCKIYVLWTYFAGNKFQRKATACIKKWLYFKDRKVKAHKRVNGIRFAIDCHKQMFMYECRPARTFHFNISILNFGWMILIQTWHIE